MGLRQKIIFSLLVGIFFSNWDCRGNVRLGIDNLAAHEFNGLAGKRVGVVTNRASVNADGISSLRILWKASEVNVVALFAPEHGVSGEVKAGERFGSQYDEKTGVWLYSLYGDTRKPTAEMMEQVDVIIYDLQDIGCRSYTFISTLGKVMEAAVEHGKRVVVLDRPNPLGGQRVEGPRVAEGFKSFVGQYDVPYVYGLTPGELARWINGELLGGKCKLSIYKMSGWNREMLWDDTGLRWVPTSPNIPSFDAVTGYVATGVLGELGIANGANHDYPFQVVAQENLKADLFREQVTSMGLKGVRSERYGFYPREGKWKHVYYQGGRFQFDPRKMENLFAFSYRALGILQEMRSGWDPFSRGEEKLRMFDKINGSDLWRKRWQAGWRAEHFIKEWESGVESWRRERERYLLY